MFALEALCSQYQPGRLFSNDLIDIAQARALLELVKQLPFSFGPECKNKFAAERQRWYLWWVHNRTGDGDGFQRGNETHVNLVCNSMWPGPERWNMLCKFKYIQKRKICKMFKNCLSHSEARTPWTVAICTLCSTHGGFSFLHFLRRHQMFFATCPRDSKSWEDNLELGSKWNFCTWNLKGIIITKDTLYDMFECFKEDQDKVSTTGRGKKSDNICVAENKILDQMIIFSSGVRQSQ